MAETFQTMRHRERKTISASRRPFWASAVPRKMRLASALMALSASASSTVRAQGTKSGACASRPAARTCVLYRRRRASSAMKARRSSSVASGRRRSGAGRTIQDQISTARASSSAPARSSQASQPQPGAMPSTNSMACPLSCKNNRKMPSMSRAARIFRTRTRDGMTIPP